MKTQFHVNDYLEIIRNGIKKQFKPAGKPKKVLIVGAGMAGLVAGYELLQAGHEPLILEAQHRLGGRILTLRDPFGPGLYGEAGAMRIPRAHQLTMAYLEKFKLPTLDFMMNNSQAYCYIHGRKQRMSEMEQDPDRLEFETAPNERGKTSSQLWNAAIAPLVEQLEKDGEAAWDEIIAQYDQYSVREFLRFKGWSEGAIEMYGVLNNLEAMMNSSFLEIFREEAGQFYTNMVQIVGGMDRLPASFYPALQHHIRFGAKMTAIDQTADSVIVHYQTGAERFTETAEYAVITVPFSVLRHIEVLQPFSRAKQRAIRQLHYDASAKIFIQTRNRFWETEEGILGGGTITDLPIRTLYYTNYGKETGRGILLASYTWSEDAQRWGSLSPENRIAQALQNVAEIHPQIMEAFEVGASKMWHDDEFAGGAFALFDPEQQTLLHEEIIRSEGRIHFAGEHASLYHAWIQGAIESGLRAAISIHQSV